MGFGRNGERVANTPMRRLPPSRGGLTVGLQSSRMLSENCHKIQRWEYSSSPRNASLLRYSGANSILPVNSRTSPLCLGAPNFSGKSVRTQPIIFHLFHYFSALISFNGAASSSAPPTMLPSVTQIMLFASNTGLMLPNNRYAIENVPILATQCSKPDTTNAIITQNITMSLPLSDFMRVPVKDCKTHAEITQDTA